MGAEGEHERASESDRGRQQGPVAAAPSTSPLAERVLSLQRRAGNAAVSRIVLARDEFSPTVTPVGGPGYKWVPPLGSSSGLPGLGLTYVPPPIPDEVAAAVKSYLATRKLAIGMRVQEGSISMPELVAMVRRECEPAQRIEPWQVEQLAAEALGPDTPPPTRGKKSPDGARAEIEARIANSLPKPPTSVTLRGAGGSLELSIDGIKAETKVAGAKVTATADKDSASVEAKKGDVSVKAEASFKGDSFGVSTKVGDVSFGAKIEKDGGSWSKWSMSLTIPIVGEPADAVPPSDQLTEAVTKANAAVGRVIAHIASGGSPTDDVVKQALADIKPAIDAVGKATAKPKGPSASLGVAASGSKGGWSAGVSLIVTF
jgi:hypothetical protein